MNRVDYRRRQRVAWAVIGALVVGEYLLNGLPLTIATLQAGGLQCCT